MGIKGVTGGDGVNMHVVLKKIVVATSDGFNVTVYVPIVTNSSNLTKGEELVIEKAAAVQKGPAKRLLNLQPSGKAKARR